MNIHRLNPMRVLNWRHAVRIDVRRALLAVTGVSGALALVFFFVIPKPADTVAAQGFGAEWRTGSIMVMPSTGDICQQSVFDNDSGVIWPAGSVSCMDALGETEKFTKAETSPGHVETVSKTFRR